MLKTKDLSFICNFRAILLAFFWTVSLICGVCVAANDQSVVILMHLLPMCRVSIVGLMLTLVLPLVITILSGIYNKNYLLFMVAILRGFVFGYCLFGFSVLYSSSAWLMHILLCYSNCATSLVLLWLWFSQVTNMPQNSVKNYIPAIIITIFIGISDYYYVSPLIELLINSI